MSPTNPPDARYTLTDLADLAGVTPRTVRYYLAQGLLPTVGAAVVLFILAAFLEGFVSASALPYAAKAGIALGSAGLLVAYLLFCGRETGATIVD